MKKQESIISAFIHKIIGSKKDDFSSKNHKNYTSLVDSFKTKLELH
jgi:hypothetical protein